MGNSLPLEIANEIADYNDWMYAEMIYDTLVKYSSTPESFILIFAPKYALIVDIDNKEDSYSGSLKVTHNFDILKYKNNKNYKQIFLGSEDMWKEKFGMTADEYLEEENKKLFKED